MRKLVLICVSLLLIAIFVQPLSAQVSVTAVPFLTIEPGARGNGMGNSFTAIADDATAPFWNPGGLGFMNDRKYLSCEYSPWFRDVADDMYLTYFGYNQPVSDLGVFSVHFHYLNMGTNVITTSEGPDPVGEFTSYDYALSLGYGTLIRKNLGVGLNVKVIHSNLSDQGQGGENPAGDEGKGTSFAIDAGLLYKDLIFKGLNVGLVVQNIGPALSYIDAAQSDPLPRNFRFALAYKAWHDENIDATVVAEGNKLLVEFDERVNTQLGQVILSGGLEVWIMKMFAARYGYYYDDEGRITDSTFGGGFRLDLGDYSGEFDFAFIPGGELQNYNKKMTISLTF